MARTALLVAGGTGGHLFPALAAREVLIARGWAVHVATDPRVGELIEGIPPEETHKIASATLANRSPTSTVRFLGTVAKGVRLSRGLLRRIRPDVLVGFGGYPTVPPLIAGRIARLPLIVHEQNAVVGQANRLLLRLGAILATGFERPKGSAAARDIVHVGNPVRAAVSAAARPYVPPTLGGEFRLLIFGGSQGARVFSDLVPRALAHLSAETRARIRLVQQARPEDLPATAETLRRLGLDADVRPFFTDLPERMAQAHLVLCRAGASTVTELAVMGRPAILVPYPHALEHQADNARALADSGGAWLVPEREIDPAGLAERLTGLMEDPKQLSRVAAAAGAQGHTDAAERLAELVERVADGTGEGDLPLSGGG